MKRLLLAALVALVAAAPASAGTRDLTIDRGIVQSVSSTQIVLRGLDGTTLTLAVGPRTLVLLNGQPSTLSAIQPGFAATVAHNGSRPARAVRAFGQKRAAKQIDKGVVVSVSPSLLVLRQLDGTIVSVSVNGHTQVVLDGVPASLASLKPGFLAAALHFGTAPARQVRALRR